MKIKLTYFAAAILLTSPAYAQTCTLTPSCEDLGYTMNSEQCNSGSSLKCPFDETKLFCYQEQDNDGEGGAIVLTVENAVYSDPQGIAVYVRGGYVRVDCGNGEEIKESWSSDFDLEIYGGQKISHTCSYKQGKEYTITITGWGVGIILKKDTGLDIKKINSLDIRNVAYVGGICDPRTTGTIPNLPPDYIGASGLGADGLFENCEQLTGPIPPLPKNLIDGTSMFAGCRNLTGPVPELPPTLMSANSMFSFCPKLTGNIPQLPANLKRAEYMFYDDRELTGSIPELPPVLDSAGSMFQNCSKLTGKTPARPASLTGSSLKDMFTGTGVSLTSDWPSSAKNAK